jgi:hypothetical protein
MRALPRAAFWLFALAVAAPGVAACDSSTEIVFRPVTVHVPESCRFVPGTPAFSIFKAGGDFDPGPVQPADHVDDVDTPGIELPSLPALTRSITLDVTQPTHSWSGLSLVADSGQVDILAWQKSATCSLHDHVDNTDATLGTFNDHRVLIVGGSPVPTGETTRNASSFVVDMRTGAVASPALGLATPRVRPTITSFGKGALVAGGASPDTGTPVATAEVYVDSDPTGDFDPTPILLTGPRANHGAVTLANGKTLLVGGTDASGKLIPSMEIVDPADRHPTTQHVARLKVPRAFPTVLKLASGEILVAGGFTFTDPTTATGPMIPVPTLEWFSADASVPSPAKHARDLVARANRAFVALDAGGALAVIAPDDTDINDSGFLTTWIITADGALEPGQPIPGLKNSALAMFRGTGGAPMLFTGAHWLRYEPWFGAFTAAESAPDDGPPLTPSSPRSITIASATSPDPGLVLWLDDVGSGGNAGPAIIGYRFGTEHAFADVPSPLLATGPSYFALDRAPTDGTRYDSTADVLKLEAGATAMVTDATFAAFALEVRSSLGFMPLVVLRDDNGNELEVGGASCSLLGGSKVNVERHGTNVTASVDDGTPKTCETKVDATARLHVGLRGSGDGATSNYFSISRREH